ncbi:1545_t:CDS:2, partial [Gigaspora margarita]
SSLENSTLLDPYKDLLLFNIVNKSLNELKVQFDQDVRDANIFDSYIYIDLEVNNVILHSNSPPDLNTQPFGPRKHASMRPQQQRIRTRVLADEGIFIKDKEIKYQYIRKVCSLGFFARSRKRPPMHSPTNYIITARSCNLKDSNLSNDLYLRNWSIVNPSSREPRSLAIRNTDDPGYPELFITDARPATIHSSHIYHAGFGTHVTCGNIKALTAFYLNKENSFSEGLIITDMNTHNEDIGGTVFFYKSQNLRYVDLCGIQVTSGPNIAAVLSSNIILEHADLILHKL